MDIHNLIKTLLGELKELVKTESVVGEPIQAGETTVIPVSKVSFGFGGGGGNTPSKKDTPAEGSGIGGGASIEPVAFIVIHDGKAQLINLRSKDGLGGKVMDLIPDLLDKVKGFREKGEAGEEKGQKRGSGSKTDSKS